MTVEFLSSVVGDSQISLIFFAAILLTVSCG